MERGPRRESGCAAAKQKVEILFFCETRHLCYARICHKESFRSTSDGIYQRNNGCKEISAVVLAKRQRSPLSKIHRRAHVCASSSGKTTNFLGKTTKKACNTFGLKERLSKLPRRRHCLQASFWQETFHSLEEAVLSSEIFTQKRRKSKTSVPSMEYGTDAELMFLTKLIRSLSFPSFYSPRVTPITDCGNGGPRHSRR